MGDIHDTHAYPGPWSDAPEETRAAVNGEFGGVTESIDGHRWNAAHFGYGAILQDKAAATKRYQDLLKTAYHLSEDARHQRIRLHATHRRGAGDQRHHDV